MLFVVISSFFSQIYEHCEQFWECNVLSYLPWLWQAIGTKGLKLRFWLPNLNHEDNLSLFVYHSQKAQFLCKILFSLLFFIPVKQLLLSSWGINHLHFSGAAVEISGRGLHPPPLYPSMRTKNPSRRSGFGSVLLTEDSIEMARRKNKRMRINTQDLRT